MALKAIGGAKGLVLVGLAKILTTHVVAVDAELRSRFGEMVHKLALAWIPALVDDMAGVTTRIQRGMTAASLGDTRAHAVTR